jgi:hypothetical protein
MKTAAATVALTATLLASCTTLAPGAREIMVTRNPADVTHCSPLGSVGAVSEVPGDDIRELRNQAVGAGADTVLITSSIIFNSGTTGLAYRCKQDQSADAGGVMGR